MNYVLAGARRAAGSAVRIRYAINRSCPRRGIADMMTACEPCRWTFQVSLTLCRDCTLNTEGVIETYIPTLHADRVSTGWGPTGRGGRGVCGDGCI
jgi:hypothetical protein